VIDQFRLFKCPRPANSVTSDRYHRALPNALLYVFGVGGWAWGGANVEGAALAALVSSGPAPIGRAPRSRARSTAREVWLMADSTAPSAGRVFISYRREETAWQAGWLFDRLVDRSAGPDLQGHRLDPARR
jgi:hypothetical protein